MSGFSSETRGDRLAQIEARARHELAEIERGRFVADRDGIEVCDCYDESEVIASDVRALVEIAKAARLIQAFDQAGGNDWWEAHAKLYAALARLDSGATEENT